MFRKLCKIRLIAVFILGLGTLSIILLFITHMNIIFYFQFNKTNLMKHAKHALQTLTFQQQVAERQVCSVPNLDINSPEIMRLLKKSKRPMPVVCSKNPDWVDVNGSTVKIADWAKKAYKSIQCWFTEVLRKSDYKQYPGKTFTTKSEFIMNTSDVFRVVCISKYGKTWSKLITGIRYYSDIFHRSGWDKVPNDSLKLNVLMFGFDSMSHNMWKRKLPKTYKYATSDLKGIALNGYNIIGDGTPQALIPILTGKTELELPDTRKKLGKKAKYVDVYPFIWNDFQKNGYATAWSEDLAQVGTFTYRLKGFQKQPVDHYTRPFYLEAIPRFNKKNYCYGGLSRFQIMLDFVRNIYEVYKDRPKFVFAFHSEYTHHVKNMVENADLDVYKWLKELKEKGYLNNTLLILMSDHGSRFADFRNTQQGKMEERLPAFIFVFPPWFEKKYPKEIQNFRNNTNRLSTPFDIHETLKNVLHFEGGGKGSVENRGISLFKEVPLSRTCKDASVEPHWCTCLNWEAIPKNNIHVQAAVQYLVEYINSYTSKHRNLCAELRLQDILWSVKLIPNESLLKFKRSKDIDGIKPDMSDKMQVSIEIYQVKVSIVPGDMLFEASIRHYINKNKFLVSVSDISRINKYSHMTHCLEDNDILHQLRKYCYCTRN